MSVAAISPAGLVVYRSGPVYIRGANQVPHNAMHVSVMVEELFALLTEESGGSARAVLGRLILIQIHPFPDGNGRSARFPMNLMLISGGWPWTIIRSALSQSVGDQGEQFNFESDAYRLARGDAKRGGIDGADLRVHARDDAAIADGVDRYAGGVRGRAEAPRAQVRRRAVHLHEHHRPRCAADTAPARGRYRASAMIARFRR